MEVTSHFIGIELKSEFFSDIFVKVYSYIKENCLENIIDFQNPLSPHITLYYLEKSISDKDKDKMKNLIGKLDLQPSIYIENINYFYKGEKNRFIMFLSPKTETNLETYRYFLHNKLQRNYIEDNNLDFCPHISFLRIKNSSIFEKHRENIEGIVNQEINKVQNTNCSNNTAFLYAVNSKFQPEVQIKI